MSRPSPRHALSLVTGWLRRADLRLVGGFILLALGLLGFIEIADVAIDEDGTPRLDEAILRTMRVEGGREPVGPAWLEELAIDLSALGSGGITAFFAVVAIGYVLLERRPRMALLVAVCAGGVWALAYALKALYQRQRPEIVTAMVDVSGLSFPSGHAMVSAALYATLGVLLSRIARRQAVKIYLVVLAVLLATIVGLTRVYLGVHYPTDVLGGWAIGFSWALACGLVARALQRKRIVEPA